MTTAPDPVALLHLVARAEAGTILGPEAVMLRHGIRALAEQLEQARRTAGGLTAKVDALTRERNDLRHQLTDRIAAAAVDCPSAPQRPADPAAPPPASRSPTTPAAASPPSRPRPTPHWSSLDDPPADAR